MSATVIRSPFDTRGWPWIHDPANITADEVAQHKSIHGIVVNPESVGLKQKYHKSLTKLAKMAKPMKRTPKRKKKE